MRLSSAVYSRPAPVPTMPAGLVELMEGLTKEVLRHNPSNVHEFCANHMAKLLEIRDGRALNQPLTLEQKIARAQEIVRRRAEERRRTYDREMELFLQSLKSKEANKLVDSEPIGIQETPSDNLKAPVHHEQDLADALEVEIFHKSKNNGSELRDELVFEEDATGKVKEAQQEIIIEVAQQGANDEVAKGVKSSEILQIDKDLKKPIAVVPILSGVKDILETHIRNPRSINLNEEEVLNLDNLSMDNKVGNSITKQNSEYIADSAQGTMNIIVDVTLNNIKSRVSTPIENNGDAEYVEEDNVDIIANHVAESAEENTNNNPGGVTVENAELKVTTPTETSNDSVNENIDNIVEHIADSAERKANIGNTTIQKMENSNDAVNAEEKNINNIVDANVEIDHILHKSAGKLSNIIDATERYIESPAEINGDGIIDTVDKVDLDRDSHGITEYAESASSLDRTGIIEESLNIIDVSTEKSDKLTNAVAEVIDNNAEVAVMKFNEILNETNDNVHNVVEEKLDTVDATEQNMHSIVNNAQQINETVGSLKKNKDTVYYVADQLIKGKEENDNSKHIAKKNISGVMNAAIHEEDFIAAEDSSFGHGNSDVNVQNDDLAKDKDPEIEIKEEVLEPLVNGDNSDPNELEISTNDTIKKTSLDLFVNRETDKSVIDIINVNSGPNRADITNQINQTSKGKEVHETIALEASIVNQDSYVSLAESIKDDKMLVQYMNKESAENNVIELSVVGNRYSENDSANEIRDEYNDNIGQSEPIKSIGESFNQVITKQYDDNSDTLENISNISEPVLPDNETNSNGKSSSMDDGTIEDINHTLFELDTMKISDETTQNIRTSSTMDLETAAVTIQKVFRTFLFKSRASTFDDTGNDENNLSYDDVEKDELEFSTVPTNINKERRTLGISRMDTVLQTVNEEKSLSLSTDDSSTLSSAATVIQAHVRGFLVRNKVNSNKSASSASLVNSNRPSTQSLEDNDQQKYNKTVLNIHIVPEGGHFLSRDESMITSMDLSLDGSPQSSTNLHPLGYDKSEPRKQLKREDAIQSISPPSNNSGKLSEESVKEILTDDAPKVDAAIYPNNESQQDTDLESHNTGTDATSITTVKNVNETKVSTNDTLSSPELSKDIDSENGRRKRSLIKMSSDESDVVTPFVSNENQNASTDNEIKLLHSGEFHDAVLPTKISRTDTSVVREFKNVVVKFLLWNNS